MFSRNHFSFHVNCMIASNRRYQFGNLSNKWLEMTVLTNIQIDEYWIEKSPVFPMYTTSTRSLGALRALTGPDFWGLFSLSFVPFGRSRRLTRCTIRTLVTRNSSGRYLQKCLRHRAFFVHRGILVTNVRIVQWSDPPSRWILIIIRIWSSSSLMRWEGAQIQMFVSDKQNLLFQEVDDAVQSEACGSGEVQIQVCESSPGHSSF